MAQQIQATAQQFLSVVQAQGQEFVKSVVADFDVSALRKSVSSGLTVDDTFALINNKTFLKYAFWIVVANAATAIATRQSARGRSPLYVILATLAAVFFGPTLIPLLTGGQIGWIQNDTAVLTAVGVTVVVLLGLRYIYALLPVRVVAAVILAAASSSVVAAGWKVGATTFKSTSGAFIIAALDAASRPFAVALEAYLVDGSTGSLTVIRSQWAAAFVYGGITIVLGNEKLAQVAAFGLLAVGFVSASLGLPIDWFYGIELLLGGRSRNANASVEKAKAAQQAAQASASQPTSPNKKKN